MYSIYLRPFIYLCKINYNAICADIFLYTLWKQRMALFICLFGILRRFQHCTGHITKGSWKDRGNQYIQLVKVLYYNCRPTESNYQLSHLRPCREANPSLRGGRQECYHSATVAPRMTLTQWKSFIHGSAKVTST